MNISQDQLTTLQNHSNTSQESCAIVMYQNDTVQNIILTQNITKSPVRFQIDQDIIYQIYKDTNSDIAIFHSHPSSPPYPSDIDKSYMIDNQPWLIYSCATDTIKAFKLSQDVITEIPIHILNN